MSNLSKPKSKLSKPNSLKSKPFKSPPSQGSKNTHKGTLKPLDKPLEKWIKITIPKGTKETNLLAASLVECEGITLKQLVSKLVKAKIVADSSVKIEDIYQLPREHFVPFKQPIYDFRNKTTLYKSRKSESYLIISDEGLISCKGLNTPSIFLRLDNWLKHSHCRQRRVEDIPSLMSKVTTLMQEGRVPFPGMTISLDSSTPSLTIITPPFKTKKARNPKYISEVLTSWLEGLSNSSLSCSLVNSSTFSFSFIS